jgi:hypothetical protein
MASAPAINKADAKCLIGTAETKNFQEYVAQCRTTDDTRRAKNLFAPSIADFTGAFEKMRAEFDDLMIIGDGTAVMANLAGNTTGQVDSQLSGFQKRKDMLLAELKAVRTQVQGIDKGFLETIMQGTPEKELAPTLQDWSLLLFSFAWMVMVLTLTAIRYISSGGWKPAAFTFAILMLVTLCLYGILQQVA